MIKHIKCDIFESGADIICHQVNCQGVMGSGIAKQVREKYPNVFEMYKKRCDEAVACRRSPLGIVLFCHIGNNKHIANLFAQDKFGYDGSCYTDYKALKDCLETVRGNASKNDIIAIPYLMGCHRGGGSWDIVYSMIEEVFGDSESEVLICEYNGG